jgi:hypothetical protein
MIDDYLFIPVKQQGYLNMYNGVDVTQTCYYIKISCATFINKIFQKYLNTWMKNYTSTSNRPTPLPTDPAWYKRFNSAIGNPDAKHQAQLATQMQLNYRAGVGELIWAMTTTHPDLAYASVKLSQANCSPEEIHFHAAKHALKHLYSTRNDGIYFWQTSPRPEFDTGPSPSINSNKQDLLVLNRPEHGPSIAHAYAGSDWASCVKTRRSFGGTVIHLTGGTIAYKSKFQPTVAGSSTEAEFMAAYDTGKMILFISSVLWDLNVPQEAATILYEDNDAATAMGNAQKLMPRTCHMEIKTFSLCEWVDQDSILMERIDTNINLANHLTKGLQRALFHRHANYLLGHIPPKYSPVSQSLIGTYTDTTVELDHIVPDSFTTSTTARAARTHAPIHEDYAGNPWHIILCHG